MLHLHMPLKIYFISQELPDRDVPRKDVLKHTWNILEISAYSKDARYTQPYIFVKWCFTDTALVFGKYK